LECLKGKIFITAGQSEATTCGNKRQANICLKGRTDFVFVLPFRQMLSVLRFRKQRFARLRL